MKNILFNAPYGLQDAVIEGWKTMTRRTDKNLLKLPQNASITSLKEEGTKLIIQYTIPGEIEQYTLSFKPRFHTSEIAAIGQSYEELNLKQFKNTPGWNNKMFTSPQYMRHFIQITNIKVEHIQDIPDNEILLEGIKPYFDKYAFRSHLTGKRIIKPTPKETYQELLNRIGETKLWQENPWVIAYTFKLVKKTQ